MSGIYPFNSLTDFERFRSTALEDLIAAETLLQLRTSAATRSIVRIYFGPPGTGKTLRAVQAATRIVDPAFPELDDFRACFSRFSGALAEQVAFITFHQSLQYEDVVESIRPTLANVVEVSDREGQSSSAGGEDEERELDAGGARATLGYQLHSGPIMRMIRRAIDNPGREHALVIDEINRGDISRILGPLISSLEPDKRLGADFPIGFEAQYPRAAGPGSRVFMPANLHVIGTMNSADRNIALVDHALRRRFEFVEVPPEPQLLGRTGDADPLDLELLLKRLNERLAFLLDKDHTVGHGYLMGCTTNADVVERFARRILPLLAEYFYGDDTGLLLALADGTDGSADIHAVEHSEESFEQTFGRTLENAHQLGYRPSHRQLSIRVDTRFWDSSAVPPGPADPDHAVAAVRKVYQAGLSATPVTAAGGDQGAGEGGADAASPDPGS